MANDEDDDYLFYGTALVKEEDVVPRKWKQALDQGKLRTSSSWHQEVFDESGRRRFHGAFSGGFSAGYYNTVGSKEGWAPKSFTSSRKKRAELGQQKAYDFMDEDEKAEHDSANLGAASEFDTFGFTAAEGARQEVARELKSRPSAIPGLPPDEIIVPVSDSIGFKLLLKMGWRHGRTIGPSHIAASSEVRSQGRKAMLALARSDEGPVSKEDINAAETSEEFKLRDESEFHDHEASETIHRSTPIYVINPKNDHYGFGFDPYKNAPEFHERKRHRVAEDASKKIRGITGQHGIVSKPSLFRPNVGRMGSGFGIGALEELDEEDEDIYAPGAEIGIMESDEEVCPVSTKAQDKPVVLPTKWKALPGFKPALSSEVKTEWFPPPTVPPDFVAVHSFVDCLDSEKDLLRPEPAEVAPPEAMELRKMIDGLATLVAKSGQRLENLYKEKKNEDPMFEFLFGGNGHAYYRRRLWEEQRQVTKEGKGLLLSDIKNKEVLDSMQRGAILGEIPLDRQPAPSIAPEDRARLQSALSSTFTKPKSQVEDIPSKSQFFKDDLAKQARFERFMKDKFQGGLRTADTFRGSLLTDLERAQETLEFEAACHDLQASELSSTASKADNELQLNLQALMSDRFAPQASDKALEKDKSESDTAKFPRREELPWRPVPLLCKRFNLPDPYLGKPPPLPKLRSRSETFVLLSNPATAGLKNSLGQERKDSLSKSEALSLSGREGDTPADDVGSPGHEAPVKNILEKPVDLYKAIFSDDSEEEESDSHEELKNDHRTTEAAQAALNRLEAGDFLASLGKELGLKVPPSEPSHSARGKENLGHSDATNVVTKTATGSQETRHEHQKRHSSYSNLINNIVAQPAVCVHTNSDNATTAAPDYPYGVDVKGELKQRDSCRPSKTEYCLGSKHGSIAGSALLHRHSIEKGLTIVSKSKESPSKMPVGFDENSSDEESDDYERKKQEQKRRKNDKKDPKSHKRSHGKHHRRKKRNKGSEHESHKHQHHHNSRKHHKSQGTDSTSSSS